MTLSEAEQILYQALAEPIGLLLRTSNAGQAKTRFYQARAKDPSLKMVQIRTSPVEGGDLILVKETIQVPARESLEEMGL